jgi:hypothetical protein
MPNRKNPFREAEKKLRRLEQKKLQIGVPGSEESGTVAEYAAHNEYGTKDEEGNQIIPERSVLRWGIRKFNDETAKSFTEVFIPKYIAGEITRAKFFGLMGMKITGIIREGFGASHLAPNAESTIKRKKHDKPLIDQTIYRSSITHVINDAD